MVLSLMFLPKIGRAETDACIYSQAISANCIQSFACAHCF